jgi:hypothetical protein
MLSMLYILSKRNISKHIWLMLMCYSLSYRLMRIEISICIVKCVTVSLTLRLNRKALMNECTECMHS